MKICHTYILHTISDEHHDGGREDADADEEVGEAEGEDELVGDGAKLGRRQHGDDDQSVAELKYDEGGRLVSSIIHLHVCVERSYINWFVRVEV